MILSFTYSDKHSLFLFCLQCIRYSTIVYLKDEIETCFIPISENFLKCKISAVIINNPVLFYPIVIQSAHPYIREQVHKEITFKQSFLKKTLLPQNL